ncbi:MAG: HepT-like ribonuclease domain-containing protein [Leptospiraceae bacterium]|nr:HepT-like ribonuclease domain-containing protein [Leptospiraceae bacterium]
MINISEEIISRHNGIEPALEDLEGQNALLMCVLQIGESLNKIQNNEWRKILPVNESYGLRNLIAHQYDSVDLSIISEILEIDFPDLKNKINNLLN